MNLFKRFYFAFLAPCLVLLMISAAQAQTPTILSAYGEFDSGASNQFVDVTFSENMSASSATAAGNYSIAGYTITSAMLFTNDLGTTSNNFVILQLDQPLTNNFTLIVNGVQSILGIHIAPNTSVAGTLDPMKSIDITSPNIVPPSGSTATVWHTGATYYKGPGEYVIDSNGQDIWNNQDGFRFVYTTRTNSFALVVQVPGMLPADTWSKAGLMARETIDPDDGGSRMVSVFTTPLATQLGLDGYYGEDSLSCAVRDTTDAGAYEPDDYVGDGVIAPSFPNQWLLLTRKTDGTNDLFTAYGSTNKLDWTWLFNFNPVVNGANAPFPSVLNVGLCASTDIYTNTLEDVTASFENFGDYVNTFSLANPQSVSVESGTSATFSVVASSATYLYNGVSYPFLDFQWYTNGIEADGATNSSYIIPLATTNLNDLSVYCVVTDTIGSAPPTNTAPATLTVAPNPAPPMIVSVYGEYDSGTSEQFVDVTFLEAIDPSSAANPANYSIAGNTITGAMLFTNNLGLASTNQVILQLENPITGSFTLNATNVRSFSGIAIAPNTSITGATLDPLSSIDITSPTAGMPSVWFNGTTYYAGDATYLVDANGQDIWNNQDGFRYVYETRTNNFAVAVQVPWILPAASWSKAGLMARQQIDPSDGGSRMAAVFTTPASWQIGLNGGYGADSLSCAVRDTTDGGAYEPADYIGDGAVAPVFPNQWLLLTRKTDGTNDLFTAYGSTNDLDWVWLYDFNPVVNGADTPFPSVVSVGMCSSTGWSDSYTNNDEFVTVMYQNFGDYADSVFVIDSPQSVSVESGTSTTFSVVAGSDATLTQNGATGPFLSYQWYTNSVAVSGATASTYTTPILTTNFNGLPVYCAITAVGSSSPIKSATATLTVTLNPTPPSLVIVDAVYDSLTGDQYVYLTLNELANVVSLANPANYAIAGYSVTDVTLLTNEQGVVDPTAVILHLNKPLTNSFTLDVSGLQSFSGIPIATNSAVHGVVATNANFYGNGLNWTLNNNGDQPTISDNVLTLTTNGPTEACSAFFNTPQSIESFTASFTYIASGDKGADGITFCLENDPEGPGALGDAGGALGFTGITNSAAFEINLYIGASGGEGIQFGTNGATPDDAGFSGFTTAPYSEPGLVNLASGDPINVQITYSQSTFGVTLLDTTTGQSFSTNYTVDLPSVLGGANTAYIGFTAGDGAVYSTQQVFNFSFVPGAVPSVAPPLMIANGADGSVLITWPSTTSPSYVLQQSASLTGLWGTVTNTPTQVGSNYQLAITATATAQFFRLMSP